MNGTGNDLLTTRQAGEILGIKPQTLALWRSAKRYTLPYHRLGYLIRYRRSDVDAFLAASRVEPVAAGA